MLGETDSFYLLSSLRALDLSENRISELPSNFFRNMPVLESLSLGQNMLKGLPINSGKQTFSLFLRASCFSSKLSFIIAARHLRAQLTHAVPARQLHKLSSWWNQLLFFSGFSKCKEEPAQELAFFAITTLLYSGLFVHQWQSRWEPSTRAGQAVLAERAWHGKEPLSGDTKRVRRPQAHRLLAPFHSWSDHREETISWRYKCCQQFEIAAALRHHTHCTCFEEQDLIFPWRLPLFRSACHRQPRWKYTELFWRELRVHR